MSTPTPTSSSNADTVTPVYFNRLLSDDERRARIFKGAIFIHSAQPGIALLAEWANELIHDAFSELLPFIPRCHATLPLLIGATRRITL